MFKAANPYDEIVGKATDENLTSENWQLNLDVCDKVSSEGESGARNCVAAILKRLVHRNANVQLYALTLSDALSKNCGMTAHRELASRSFCQTLQRIVSDRNTHATVKRKTTSVMQSWSQEWGQDESLGILRETMTALRNQGITFDNEPKEEEAVNEPSSERLRAEDEELRRVLELSLHDQGGRNTATEQQGLGAGGSSSSSAPAAVVAASSSANGASGSQAFSGQGQPSGSTVQENSSSDPSQALGAPQQAPSSSVSSRVRALYDFTPTEEGELAFTKGDVIRVLDSVYEHWWRGELRGEAGIFPVNYVELLPDPTPAEIQREAEMEALVFAQANDIDRLLSRLRGLDPARDNLAEDEELQELYQSSLTMRPKIVKLIDRYNLKVNELRTMNDKFVRARETFDVMMEQSLARYSNSANWQGNSGPVQSPAHPSAAVGSAPPNAASYPYVTPSQSNASVYHSSSPSDQYGQATYAQQPQQASSYGQPHQQLTPQKEYDQGWTAWQGQQLQQQPQQSLPSQPHSQLQAHAQHSLQPHPSQQHLQHPAQAGQHHG